MPISSEAEIGSRTFCPYKRDFQTIGARINKSSLYIHYHGKEQNKPLKAVGPDCEVLTIIERRCSLKLEKLKVKVKDKGRDGNAHYGVTACEV